MDSARGRFDALIYGGLVFVSIAMLAVAFGELLAANREFRNSADDLAECTRLVSEIASLENRPHVASLEVESPQEIIERVAAAQLQAAVPSTALVSVAPSLPLRVRATDYQQRATELVLQNVTLAKIASFAEALDSNQDGLIVRDIVLTPAQAFESEASNAAERWDARLTLTQLIYSPTSK